MLYYGTFGANLMALGSERYSRIDWFYWYAIHEYDTIAKHNRFYVINIGID